MVATAGAASGTQKALNHRDRSLTWTVDAVPLVAEDWTSFAATLLTHHATPQLSRASQWFSLDHPPPSVQRLTDEWFPFWAFDAGSRIMPL